MTSERDRAGHDPEQHAAPAAGRADESYPEELYGDGEARPAGTVDPGEPVNEPGRRRAADEVDAAIERGRREREVEEQRRATERKTKI